MSGFVLLRGVPRRCADHARTRRQRDDAGLADPPHPAAERHLDAEILACLEKCCRTVDLDLLVGDREPNGAALPAVIGAGDGEPFDVQPVSQAAVLVVRLHRVEQRHRPAGPAFPLTPIRRPLVHPGYVEFAHLPGQLEIELVLLGFVGELLHLVEEDHVLPGGGGVDVDDVRRLPVRTQLAQHRDDRGDAATCGDEEDLARYRFRRWKSPLGDCNRMMEPGFTPSTR